MVKPKNPFTPYWCLSCGHKFREPLIKRMLSTPNSSQSRRPKKCPKCGSRKIAG